MFDGVTFMCLSAFFFVMSRSLSSEHWQRYYGSLLLLLAVDSAWIVVSICRGIPLKPWLILNGVLGAVLIGTLYFNRSKQSKAPPIICAVATFCTGILGYIYMSSFYFP
jgi:hypothetical protein